MMRKRRILSSSSESEAGEESSDQGSEGSTSVPAGPTPIANPPIDTDFSAEDHFVLVKTSEKTVKSLNATSIDHEIHFVNLEPVAHRLKDIFDAVIDRVLESAEEKVPPDVSTRIRFILHAGNLTYPINVSFSALENFSTEVLMNEVEKILNSNESFDISSSMKVNVIVVHLPLVGGKRIGGFNNRIVTDLKDYLRLKKSVIRIHSSDNNCFPLALCVAEEYLVKCGKNKNLSSANEQDKLLRKLTFQHISNLSASINTKLRPGYRWTMDDITALSSCYHFKKYCITLYDVNSFAEVITVYNQESTAHIDLLFDYSSGHVDVITSMSKFLSSRFYCYSCHKPYHSTKHACPASGCPRCRAPGCVNRRGYLNYSDTTTASEVVICDQCGVSNPTKECLDEHLRTASCSLYFTCAQCRSTVLKRNESTHRCFHKKCLVCYRVVPNVSGRKAHKCHIQKPRRGATDMSDEAARESSEFKGNSESDSGSEGMETIEEPFAIRAKKSKKQTRTLQSNVKVEDKNIYCFDIETDQSSASTVGYHQPVLLISKKLSSVGYEDDSADIYYGYDCIDEFCGAIFKTERSREYEWYFAHFGSGFDFLPILEWLHKYQVYIPKVVLRGNRIISMKVGNKRFIDSILFIPIALAGFPKTFGLGDISKGFFPHLLTSPSAMGPRPSTDSLTCVCSTTTSCCYGRNKVFSHDCSHCRKIIESGDNREGAESFNFQPGQFPSMCFFGVDNIKSTEKFVEFQQWHREQVAVYKDSLQTYNFRQEIIKYCLQDVHILRDGIKVYRSLIKSLCSGIDPFEVACTASSACNHIYRQLFMPEDSIAILPTDGYRTADKSSHAATVWLIWMEYLLNEEHKAKGQRLRCYRSCGGSSGLGTAGEQRIQNMKLDGLFLQGDVNGSMNQPAPAVVLDFFGCYYHGCPTCYTQRSEMNTKIRMSMGDLYQTTVLDRLARLQTLQKQNKIFETSDNFTFFIDKIVVIWGCQFTELLRKASLLEKQVDNGDYTMNDMIGYPDYTTSDLLKLQQIHKAADFYSPLIARESFSGGRTENFRSFWHKDNKNSENNFFHYLDICSLYPWVNANSVYPVGHPDQVLVASVLDDDCDDGLKEVSRKLPAKRKSIFEPEYFYCSSHTDVEKKVLDESYFGLVKCLVLPPRDLLIPVLPFHYNSKLYFPLCRTCVEESCKTGAQKGLSSNNTARKFAYSKNVLTNTRNNSQNTDQLGVPTGGKCQHIDSKERAFKGVFCTPELKLALAKGYRILDVAEIWSWNSSNRSSDLFKKYIHTFLKVKAEASGWPNCSCDHSEQSILSPHKTVPDICEHRQSYLDAFAAKEGVNLDPEKIEKNEGLRFIAKILLNSFWGYLGMRENLPKTKFLSKYSELIKYFTARTKIITDACLVGNNSMFLQYQATEDAIDPSKKTNVVLAAFTTAHARVKLYSYMEQVKDSNNVLYCDTDSIMYVGLRHGDIPTGKFMGDMTDEMPGNVVIDTFMSAGPKFYLLSGDSVDKDGESKEEYNVFKVKGITINRATQNTLNPDHIKKLVLGEIHKLEVPFRSMRRCKKSCKITNHCCKKTCRVTNSKRQFDESSGCSTPYGFCFNFVH